VAERVEDPGHDGPHVGRIPHVAHLEHRAPAEQPDLLRRLLELRRAGQIVRDGGDRRAQVKPADVGAAPRELQRMGSPLAPRDARYEHNLPGPLAALTHRSSHPFLAHHSSSRPPGFGRGLGEQALPQGLPTEAAVHPSPRTPAVK